MEPVRRDDSGRNVMKEERKEQSRRGEREVGQEKTRDIKLTEER